MQEYQDANGPADAIDLRSDTITRPTPEMRRAMAEAPVGDDVFDEDPTVTRLQETVAAMFGKEAALFVPSGTMSNQLCVNVHTQPGDELICDANCHIYNYEAGGAAVHSGVTCRCLEGDFGILDVSQLEDKMRPINQHLVKTRLVCLENTHNKGGGRVYPLEKIQAISAWAKSHGVAMHMDGARIWNAIVASGISAKDWGAPFDTISVCFSKGLGAPVGSALIGTKEFVQKAHFVRKRFGGGMRQVGIIAAGALYAVENHIERMVEDHQNAQIIAQAIADTPGLRLSPPEVETNLIWFHIDPEVGTADDLIGGLRKNGVLVHKLGPYTARACTHLDISKAQAEQAADVIRAVVPKLVPAGA